MDDSLVTAFIFGLLSFFHFWGGAALAAAARGRRLLPLLWGVLIGVAPAYFGLERGQVLGEWGWLGWQIIVLVSSTFIVAYRLPRLTSMFLSGGMSTLMIGTFIMAAGAIAGASLFRLGSEVWSLLAGGMGFLFGSLWFGAGIKQLRGR